MTFDQFLMVGYSVLAAGGMVDAMAFPLWEKDRRVLSVVVGALVVFGVVGFVLRVWPYFPPYQPS